MIIKLEYKADIRRFTVDDVSVSQIKSLATKAFGVPAENVSLFYTNETGEKKEVSTNEDFQSIHMQKPNTAIKLAIELNTQNKPIFVPATTGELGFQVNRGADLARTTTTTTSSQTSNVMPQSPKDSLATLIARDSTRQEELQQLISESMKTPEFHQLVENTIQSMIPQFVSIVAKTAAKKLSINQQPFHLQQQSPNVIKIEQKPFLEEFVLETVPQLVQETTSEITNAIKSVLLIDSSSSSSSSLSSDSDDNNNNNIVIKEEIPEIHLEKSTLMNQEINNNNNIENNIKVEEEEKPIIDKNNNNENQHQVEKEKEEEEVVDEEVEPFVMVDNDNNNNTQSSVSNAPPLVGSIISFFRGSQHSIPKEPVVPNMEEMLEQLHNMGFTDREMNKRTLLFHNRFQEGLDAVVEDLLQQQAGQ